MNSVDICHISKSDILLWTYSSNFVIQATLIILMMMMMMKVISADNVGPFRDSNLLSVTTLTAISQQLGITHTQYLCTIHKIKKKMSERTAEFI